MFDNLAPAERRVSFVEPSILATAVDAVLVKEDGAYLVVRDATVAYHGLSGHISKVSGVIRGSYLNPSRALNAFNGVHA